MRRMPEQELRLPILLQSMQAASPSRRHQNPCRFQVAPANRRLDLHRFDLSFSVRFHSLQISIFCKALGFHHLLKKKNAVIFFLMSYAAFGCTSFRDKITNYRVLSWQIDEKRPRREWLMIVFFLVLRFSWWYLIFLRFNVQGEGRPTKTFNGVE